MKFTSRERFEILKKCVLSYYEKANNLNDMFWLFSVDLDDSMDDIKDFSRFLKTLDNVKFLIFASSSKSKIDAINRDINKFTQNAEFQFNPSNIEDGFRWDILLNISDDQFAEVQGYDDIIRDFMGDDLDNSLWFYDGIQQRINTQEIVGRKYYERFNYIYHPAYKSLFCDDESTAVAQMLGKLKKSDQCIIKHYHASQGFFPEDALYEKNNKFWDIDGSVFAERKKNNFDIY